MLHLHPTYIQPVAFYQFNLIGELIWGLIAFIWLGIPGPVDSPYIGMDVDGADCHF